MKEKSFIKSKRFWGIVITVAAKIASALWPQYSDIATHIMEGGALLFGVGTVTAQSKIKFK